MKGKPVPRSPLTQSQRTDGLARQFVGELGERRPTSGLVTYIRSVGAYGQHHLRGRSRMRILRMRVWSQTFPKGQETGCDTLTFWILCWRIAGRMLLRTTYEQSPDRIVLIVGAYGGLGGFCTYTSAPSFFIFLSRAKESSTSCLSIPLLFAMMFCSCSFFVMSSPCDLYAAPFHM